MMKLNNRNLLYLSIFLLAVFFSAGIKAEELDSVILATNISYADFSVASVVGNHIGAPVLLAAKDHLPTETLEALEEVKPKTVYILGGPAVINEDVENKLKERYDVVRIWGMTRFGTAAEAAKYFWADGSNKSVLVWDHPDGPLADFVSSQLVMTAKELAVSEDVPLILIPKNALPLEVRDALTQLGVKEVTVVGNVGENLSRELSDINITISDHIKGNVSDVLKEAKKRIMKRFGRKIPFQVVVVAIGSWKDTILLPYIPHMPTRSSGAGFTLFVRNESEIPSIVEQVKRGIENGTYSGVKVVGYRLLAEKIVDALKKEGIDVEYYGRVPFKVTAKMLSLYKRKINELRQRYLQRTAQIRVKLKRKGERIKEDCKQLYELSEEYINNTNVNSTNTSQYGPQLERIKELKDACLDAAAHGNYLKAIELRQKLKHYKKSLEWSLRGKIKDFIDDQIEKETQPPSIFRKRIIERVARIERERSENSTLNEENTSEPQEPQEERKQQVRNLKKRTAMRINERDKACKELLNKVKELIREGKYGDVGRLMQLVKLKCEKREPPQRDLMPWHRNIKSLPSPQGEPIEGMKGRHQR